LFSVAGRAAGLDEGLGNLLSAPRPVLEAEIHYFVDMHGGIPDGLRLLLAADTGAPLRDIAKHRRWMIRAFAVALAVGSQRIWLGLLLAPGGISFELAFGIAFWLGFVLSVLAGEAYLARVPALGRSRSAQRRARQAGTAMEEARARPEGREQD